MNRTVDERLARLRAHLNSAMLEEGMSLGHVAAQLGLDKSETLSGYLSGREPIPVWVLMRLADLLKKPLWWFFDEQPQGISLEAAQIALQNISRIKLYLEALETEFQLVTSRHKKEPTFTSYEPEQNGTGRTTGQVVDFSQYLKRAQMILQREFDSDEPPEVSQESVEMVAQGLLSAEISCPVTDMVERLRRRRGSSSLEESVGD